MDRSPKQVSRRAFLKGAGGFALGTSLALGADLSPVVARARSLKIEGAEEIPGVCPYCAVGCGTLVSIKTDNQGFKRVVNIEGNPDSPISKGTLCPKGSASFQLVVNPLRATKVKHRKPGASDWEDISLEAAMDRIAELVKKTRDETFTETYATKDKDGKDVNKKVNHTLAIASLGGATLDNEWNYIQAKLMRTLGVVHIENQARI